MDTDKLLEKLGIEPEKPVLLITAKEALFNLVWVIDEYCPNLKIKKMKKEEILSLLKSYANCVNDYQPESYHQERGALLENFEMLKKYGLTDDDYGSLDFC